MHRLVVVMAISCWSFSAHGQREFIEEVEPAPRSSPDVDLDSPDPAAEASTARSVVRPVPPVTSPANDTSDRANTAGQGSGTADTGGLVPPAVDVAATEPQELLPVFSISEGGQQRFQEKVSRHFASVLRGEPGLSRKTVADVRQGAVEAAIHGVRGGFGASAVGQALVREARQAFDAGRPDEAAEIITAALEVAPSDLTTALGILQFRFDSVGPIEALGELGLVASALVADPIERGNIVARVAAVALLTVLLLLALGALVIALPVLPVVVFDLVTRLPRGVHPAQGWLLVATIGAAPFLLGLGIVPSMLWLCVMTVASMARRSRVVLCIMGALSVTAPSLVSVLATSWTAPSSTAAIVHRALFDVDGNDAVAKLTAAEAAGAPLDLLARVAIANDARRAGRVSDALRRYRDLVQSHGDVSYVHGGFGVTLATAGDDDLALAELGLAMERARADHGSTVVASPAAFDASLLHHAAGMAGKANALLGPLAESNPDGLVVMRRATVRAVDETVHHNRSFVEVLPPRSATQALLGGPAADVVELAIGRLLWRGLPMQSATLLLAALVLLMVVVSALGPRIDMATTCTRCGAPSSRRADGPEVPSQTCAACFHAFVSTKSRVDAAVRTLRERSIYRRRHRRARLMVMLSVWPGAGHLFAGAGARGGVFAVVGTASALAALASSDGWPGPRMHGDMPVWMLVAPFGVAFCVVLAVSVRSALGLAAEERRGSR